MALLLDPALSERLERLFTRRANPDVMEATRQVKARVQRRNAHLRALAETLLCTSKKTLWDIKKVFTRSPNALLYVLDQAEAATKVLRPGTSRHLAAERYAQALRLAATRLSQLHDELALEAALLDKIDAGA